MTPPTIYTIRCVIFSTHSVVSKYDTPNYLYDKVVSYFLLILWLEYMTPPTIYNDKGVSYFLRIRWLEYMTLPTIYTIRWCHIFYSIWVVRIYDTP